MGSSKILAQMRLLARQHPGLLVAIVYHPETGEHVGVLGLLDLCEDDWFFQPAPLSDLGSISEAANNGTHKPLVGSSNLPVATENKSLIGTSPVRKSKPRKHKARG